MEYEKVIEAVKKQPTAYDVDKVVKQLKERLSLYQRLQKFVNNANRIRKVVEASKEDYQILFDRGYLLQMLQILS